MAVVKRVAPESHDEKPSACDAPIAPHGGRVIYGADPHQVLQLHARCEQLWTEARGRARREPP